MECFAFLRALRDSSAAGGEYAFASLLGAILKKQYATTRSFHSLEAQKEKAGENMVSGLKFSSWQT